MIRNNYIHKNVKRPHIFRLWKCYLLLMRQCKIRFSFFFFTFIYFYVYSSDEKKDYIIGEIARYEMLLERS